MSINSNSKVAFIGLGVMGYPMAGYLQQKGYQVTVYNRTTAKAEKWAAQYGGSWAATPFEAAKGAELVFMCVGNDNDVRSVVYGEHGVLGAMAAGSVLIDHTTASAELARELSAAAAEKGVGFLDAPVSGGQAGAENGVLTVMIGGEQVDMAKAEAAIMCFARCAKLLGPAGSGQLAKMVNQICIAGVVQGLAEALNFAQNAGLDGAAVVEVISQGAASSWQMQNRSLTMLDNKYDFGFAVDWMRKDLGIALNEARQNGSHLPLTALVDQFYSEVQQMGGGRWDTSSLLARLKR
ncbi:MAG: oxidoreductase [Alteromonadaceae bacterium]|jgi:2-hydroxy-3-oxopropionate reductase|uniref:NAD(P)-dependent oxidoreductase n=1 Tax=Rheinheimera aquimaris TaxID=412437 RepID=UPI000C514B5B|nr:NAD(P)-dependent oxidoreductase [Rheinheimera aquimaris]MBJ91097.1 oxidoreductase [Alteromonadaceae bacterium]HBN88899.1 oxidoreductase [Rheinheimera sp.]|tara:strand:+ start:4312 stop:5193 length:882 start_codon:yes stop_codon:yes gene_type:complete